MNGARKTLVLAAAMAFVLTLGACSSSDGPTGCAANPTGPGCGPTPTPTPPPVRTIIATATCEGIGVNTLCSFDLATSQRGDLDVTVDWTFPEDVIQVMVANGSCTLDQINASQCTFIGTAPASTTPKPRVLTIRAVAAGNYQVYVGNRGPKTETLSVQVGLTTPGSASSSTATRVDSVIVGRPYTSRVAAH
jgi:hypothetical protein